MGRGSKWTPPFPDPWSLIIIFGLAIRMTFWTNSENCEARFSHLAICPFQRPLLPRGWLCWIGWKGGMPWIIRILSSILSQYRDSECPKFSPFLKKKQDYQWWSITVDFWIIKVHTSNWSSNSWGSSNGWGSSNSWDHRIVGDHRVPLDLSFEMIILKKPCNHPGNI